MFSFEQLELMLKEVAEDRNITDHARPHLIRALQNRLAECYLNEYLGGILFDSLPERGRPDAEPNDTIAKMFPDK